MTSALVDLTGRLGSWRAARAIGYYIHAGRVYFDGVLYNEPGDPLTRTLLTGLPAEARPSSPVSFTIPADLGQTDYTPDAAITLPSSYAATLNTDGSLTLDHSVPGQLIDAPDVSSYYYVDSASVHYPRYPDAMSTALILSNLSWSIGGGTDSPTYVDLGSYIGGDFANIDAQYAVHGERVHLTGTASAIADGATQLLNPEPPDATDGLSGLGNDMPVKKGSETFLAEILPGFVGLTDTLVKPAGQPGPLAWAAPRSQIHNPVFGGSRSIPTGQNFTSFLTTSVGGGVPGTDGGQGPGVDAAAGHLDYGTYACGGSTCHSPGALPAVTLRLAGILATIDPVPDWFMLGLNYAANVRTFANDGTCSGGSCGPLLSPNFGFSLAVSGGASMTLTELDGVTPVVFVGTEGGVDGWLVPDSPLYTGLTHLPTDSGGFPTVAGAIWKWGQLAGDISITPGGLVNVVDWGCAIRVVPLYELPVHGFRAGDVVNLDGTGWAGTEGVPVPTPAAGSITAGQHTTGIIRLG